MKHFATVIRVVRTLLQPVWKSMPASAVETLDLPHGPTPVLWRRSTKASRVSLRIDPREAHVVVTLPVRAAQASGRALVMTHADWIAERLGRLAPATPFVDGAELPLDGQRVRICHVQGGRGIRLEDGKLLVGGSPEFLARRVTDFLRTHARQRLGDAALAKAQLVGLRVRRVVVKDTCTRWGSCTMGGTLMFSWRLVMAPPDVQDYVVGHEVAHLRHMDHGAAFWELVDRLTPHRDAATRWLTKAGSSLMRVG